MMIDKNDSGCDDVLVMIAVIVIEMVMNVIIVLLMMMNAMIVGL